jgi:G3E family GTPase
MEASAAAIPVNVITGFLGSGKTTLLQHILTSEAFADTAVLINEFGEVGLDHNLLEVVDEEIRLLQSGCICCTIRGELADAIRDLYSKRERGLVPPFRRLVIETTGLADPAPVLSTILADPVLRHHFRLGNVVCCVDAVNADRHLDRQPEAVRQVAAADRIILAKTDLAGPDQSKAVRARLARLNPAAPIQEAIHGDADPAFVLAHDLHDPARRLAEVARWLGSEATSGGHEHGADGGHDVNRHDAHIRAFTLTFDGQLDWTAFGIWLTMLLHARGEDILRVKGILDVAESETPVVIHGVQHVVHPPIHLEGWPGGERRSRLVFITRDISKADIERSLAAFNRLAARLVRTSNAA